MSQEELQKRYERLLLNVKKMRLAQIDYFKFKGGTYFNKARHYEKEVDAIIKEEVAAQKSNQTNLF